MQKGLSRVSQESSYGSHVNQPFWGLLFSWLLVSDYRVAPTSCLPLIRVVIAYFCYTLYLPVFSTPRPTSQVPPCSGGAPIHLGPTWWALRRAVGAGIWSISWHRPYCCILPACWGTSADSGPGIPLDCSPQTLGQEVAVRRARQRLAVGMGAGKRKLCPGDTWQVGWRDRFWPCPLTLTS